MISDMDSSSHLIECEELPRRLGAGALVTLTVGIIVGSGIFRSPSTIAALAGSATMVAAVWLVGGIITICLALCLAELGSMFPKTGGLYVYLEEAFGRRIAFLFGWTFLLINPANWAAIALIMAGYTARLASLSGNAEKLVATAALLLVCAINIVSLTAATRFNVLFTIVKAGALLGIAATIFLLRGVHPDAAPVVAGSFGSFGLAIVAVLWPYEGVSAVSGMAGEVKDPGHNLSRGLLGGVAAVTVLYLGINAAYVYALSVTGVANSTSVAVDAMQSVAGHTGAVVIAVCALFATLGALAAGATCDPRILFAMARDRMFFASAARVHPVAQTPFVAIAVSGVLAIAYVWVSTFEELADQFVLGMWIFYALAVFGLIVLRVRRPDLVRPYRVPLYPVLPVLFLFAALGLLINAFVELPRLCAVNLAIVAVGWPIYEIWSRFSAAQKSGPVEKDISC